MRISDWSSDVCSSDLQESRPGARCWMLDRRKAGRGHATHGARLSALGLRGWYTGGRLRRRHYAVSPGGWRRTLQKSASAQIVVHRFHSGWQADRKSGVWGKSVSVRVNFGCRRYLKKKKKKHKKQQ